MASKLLILLTLSSLAIQYATCHDEDDHHDMVSSTPDMPSPPNYFRHPHHTGWIYAHIILMILSWFFILPVMVFLRITRSRRLCGTSQIAFHGVNLAGLLTGWIYNASTPDLYSCNVHGMMGWIGTLWAAGSSLAYIYKNYLSGIENERQSLDSTSSGITAFLRRLRLGSISGRRNQTRYQHLELATHEDEESDTESIQSLEKYESAYSSSSTLQPCTESKDENACTITSISGSILDRLLLLVGFAICVSGFVVYSGNFRGLEVYGGLSHWIKGGIFFWVGLLTMGRWIGAFSDLGWAWNTKPTHCESQRWKNKVLSLEFVESFLIWLYGASNVFLEHLSNWGGEWSATDFEHISITVLFFGGGLLGMVVEAEFVRRLVHKNDIPLERERHDSDETITVSLTEPLQERSPDRSISLNPLPSLTIGFLGLMMSNHHQHTALGAQIHAQWGYLFFASALARICTLISLYHKPPTAYPARPITELITAFCLTGGGILFMMSGRDSIAGLEANKIVAMTAFTGTMGLSAVILSWEVVCFGIKGWAERRA